jgi:DNA replication protein DnaC
MNSKKKELIKRKIKDNHGCLGDCPRCFKHHVLIDKMEESNIPVGYWMLTMKNFYGSDILKGIIEDYIKQIDGKYENCESICLSGNQGTGKTMSSILILKQAIKNGYSAYYTTAIDMFNEIISGNNYFLKSKLKTTDFLIIDELDSRFFPSDAVKELFSSVYESIYRTRCHNLLPTIICTNETENILNVFYGAGIQSIDSLNKQYLKIYPFAGKDFRKNMES